MDAPREPGGAAAQRAGVESAPGSQKKRYGPPDDLQLAGYEALWLKVELIEALRAALEAAHENQVWKRWRRSERD